MMRAEAMTAEAMTARAMKAEAARCNADRTLHSDDQREPTHNAEHRGELSAKPPGRWKFQLSSMKGAGLISRARPTRSTPAPATVRKISRSDTQCVLRTMRLERLMPLLVQSGSLRIDPPCTDLELQAALAWATR